MKNKKTRNNYLNMLKLCSEFKIRAIFLSIALIGTSFLSSYPIKYIEKIINICSSSKNDNMEVFIKGGLIYLILQILNVIFRALFEYFNADLESKLGHKIRIMLFEKLEKMPFKFYESNNKSEIIMRLVQDSSVTVDGILQPLTFIIKNILTFALGFIYMYSIDKTLTLIMIPIGLIISIFVLKTGPKISKLSYDERESNSKLWNGFSEALNGIREIKVNCQEKRILKDVERSSDNTRKVIMNLKKYTIKVGNINSAIVMSIIALIMILGGYKVIQGTLSIGGLTAIMMYNGLLIDPIVDFFNLFQQMQKVFVSCDKIFLVLNHSEEPINLKTLKDSFNENIKIDRLYFKYINDDSGFYNLNSISLQINKGDKVALVGYSGSGKSTLCKILVKLYDDFEGNASIDGISLKDINNENIRNIIGIVFQDTFLFSGTLEDNLKFAKPNVSEEELKNALEMSGVSLFLENLPNGLNTIIGENGFNLSGGEKQRVSICRTILKNPQIIILDESTSALDAITTSIVMKNLLELFKYKTVIFTAHKLSNIANVCNKIYVFDKGSIVEYGDHDKLIKKDGLYKKMYNAYE
ncbi:ABC transporter ATP-binding protein [Clostridium sp. ATCC 25772]|uniref:ABC transporter ATP-binding protein n=1 Tax=Clostridium sp. ATCC 25772 TaxID=1676991 RepID=UPI000781FB2B|nr:ABC transporter ATP-binding protein [Clostridium sp. ATCC 25772]